VVGRHFSSSRLCFGIGPIRRFCHGSSRGSSEGNCLSMFGNSDIPNESRKRYLLVADPDSTAGTKAMGSPSWRTPHSKVSLCCPSGKAKHDLLHDGVIVRKMSNLNLI